MWLQRGERRVSGVCVVSGSVTGPGDVGRTLAFIQRVTRNYRILAQERGMIQFTFLRAHCGCREGSGW